MDSITLVFVALGAFALGWWLRTLYGCKCDEVVSNPKSGGGPGEENDQPGP